MRDDLRKKFIADCGWADASVEALPGDASRRRYFRLTLPDGLGERRGSETRLVMDMPPHPEEKFAEFILLARHLSAIGLSAPDIYAADAENGFALIEDFGEDTFTRLLNAGHDPESLYSTAIAAAAELQIKSMGADLPLKNYDAAEMSKEIMWFIEWYAPIYWQRKATAEEQAEFLKIIYEIFDGLPALPPALLLRDFHVDNFMWLPDRSGVRRCGILDFQDAKWGSPVYDLVSMLEDARRDIDSVLVEKLCDQYLELRPDISRADFDAHYAGMGIMRHARILGNFIRLCVRDDKPQYLQFMPRVMQQFLNALEHPIAMSLKKWCAKCLPDLGTGNWELRNQSKPYFLTSSS